MREDTQVTPLGAPTLAELAKLVDVVVEDTIEKALTYTQVDEEVNAQKKQVISLYCVGLTNRVDGSCQCWVGVQSCKKYADTNTTRDTNGLKKLNPNTTCPDTG